MLTHSNPVHNKTTQADNLVFDIFGTRLVNLASDSNNFQKVRGFVGFSFLFRSKILVFHSIPDVLLIKFDFVPIEKLAVFLLKCLISMMFFLILDVLNNTFPMGRTY